MKQKFRMIVKQHISYGHRLKLPYESPCKRMHGHNSEVTVVIEGTKLDNYGMIIDFSKVKEIIKKYDHVFLNDFMDENTTAENISKRIYNDIRKHIGKEYKLIVEFPETENNIIQYGDLE